MNARSAPSHTRRVEQLGFHLTWRDAIGRHTVDIGPYCVDYSWPWWSPGADNPLPDLRRVSDATIRSRDSAEADEERS